MKYDEKFNLTTFKLPEITSVMMKIWKVYQKKPAAAPIIKTIGIKNIM